MSYRFRLYPDVSQSPMMATHCAHARAVWNLGLEQARLARQFGSYADQKLWDRQLADARSTIDWLGAGSSSVQQGALRDLRQAFRNWWSNPAHFGHPTWRRAGIHEGFVIRDVTIKRLNRKWATVQIPKVGPVRFRLHRALPSTYGHGRVTLDRSGRWHVSFTTPQPAVPRTTTGSVIGVDLGVAVTATTSAGDQLALPALLTPGEAQRLRRLQRQLARQQKGSNRRRATRHKIAVLRARETDRRKDWIEQTTTRLVRDHDLIGIEDLQVANMTRSAKGTLDQPGTRVAQKRGLNRAITNQSWAMFRCRLEQKAAATPNTDRCVVVAISPAYTSQRCHRCGHTAKNNRESQAVFRCAQCGHTANADINAACNIRDLAVAHHHAAGHAVTGRGGTPDRAQHHHGESHGPDETSTTPQLVPA